MKDSMIRLGQLICSVGARWYADAKPAFVREDFASDPGYQTACDRLRNFDDEAAYSNIANLTAQSLRSLDRAVANDEMLDQKAYRMSQFALTLLTALFAAVTGFGIPVTVWVVLASIAFFLGALTAIQAQKPVSRPALLSPTDLLDIHGQGAMKNPDAYTAMSLGVILIGWNVVGSQISQCVKTSQRLILIGIGSLMFAIVFFWLFSADQVKQGVPAMGPTEQEASQEKERAAAVADYLMATVRSPGPAWDVAVAAEVKN